MEDTGWFLLIPLVIAIIVGMATRSSGKDNPGYFNRGSLQRMSSEKLKRYVAIAWRNRGYTAEIQFNNLEYIDVIASSSEEVIAISARRKREEDRVSEDAVKRFAKSSQKQGADRRVMVTSSYFTESACETADQLGVELLDGESLAQIFTRCEDLPE